LKPRALTPFRVTNRVMTGSRQTALASRRSTSQACVDVDDLDPGQSGL
jgi:hypothetical protein